MKPRTLLALLALLLLSFRLTAQTGLIPFNDDVLKIKQNVLAVVTKAQDEKVMSRLKNKPDELAAYKSSLDVMNNLVKEIVPVEWDISKEIKFISEPEAEKLRDEKARGYSLLEIGAVSNRALGDFYSANKNYGFNSTRDLAYHMSNAGSSVALTITNTDSPKREIIASNLPIYGVTKGSITYMLRHLKNQVNDYASGEVTSWNDLKHAVEAKTPQMKSKTLLLFDPLISPGLQKALDAKEVEKFYAYKYEVVSLDKAESILIGKEKDYALAWVVPAGLAAGSGVLYNYYVIDAQDARQLFISGKAAVGADGTFDRVHLVTLNKELK